MIADVRCSPQYSKSEDSGGSESSQQVQALQKQIKQVESQIEVLNSKEALLRDVLVAVASGGNFNFIDGLEKYDSQKLQVRTRKEELEEELALLQKKIREVGVGQGGVHILNDHQMTGSMDVLWRLLTVRDCEDQFGSGKGLRSHSPCYHK
jgi:DNA repair exonuclease SbcCD ATPase subunit